MPEAKKAELIDELQFNFLNYSEEVIKNRAIPDGRDGLKPVHRRILWTMWEMGCKSNSTMKKCARVVGDCMKYHPHGDIALYETLVRMAQYFSVGIPLIKSQGNFGSFDDSGSFAAHRYTECKLSEFSEDVLFADIDDEAVDFVDNYTGEFKEPLVFPARIPLILLTGSNGIAVGMKTDILPHNLKEVCSGLLAVLKNPMITLGALRKYIPAPDFPLGGKVLNNDDLKRAYETGNGLCAYRAPYQEDGRSIVFTSIPYAKDKCDIVAGLAKLVRDGKLTEVISDVTDETEKENIQIKLDVKRTVSLDNAATEVYRCSDLATNLTMNNIVISNQKPKLTGLLDIFKDFIAFRKEVILKRTQNRKQKAEAKKEIVDGVIVAINNSEAVLKIIRTNDKPVEALQTTFKLSQRQADYVFNMPVKKFSKQDTSELQEEEKELSSYILEHAEIIKHPEKINEIIEQETKEISKKHGYDRKTIIESV